LHWCALFDAIFNVSFMVCHFSCLYSKPCGHILPKQSSLRNEKATKCLPSRAHQSSLQAWHAVSRTLACALSRTALLCVSRWISLYVSLWRSSFSLLLTSPPSFPPSLFPSFDPPSVSFSRDICITLSLFLVLTPISSSHHCASTLHFPFPLSLMPPLRSPSTGISYGRHD